MDTTVLCAICREPGHLGEAHYDGHAVLATALGLLLIADTQAVVALLLGAYALLICVGMFLQARPPAAAARW